MSGLDPETWRRIEGILDRALDLPAGEHEAFLDEACGDDHGLRRHVEKLLGAVSRADGFLAAAHTAPDRTR